MSILSKIQSLISAANSATGESDTTLTDAVQTLVDGYGQGGGGENKEAKIIDGTLTGTYHNDDVITIRANGFSGMSQVTRIEFPNCTTAANFSLSSCSNLETAFMPKLAYTNIQTFAYCSKLRAFDLTVLPAIKSQDFRSCTVLNLLVMRKTDSLVALAATNAFDYSPFGSGGSGGTIYIPKALYDHLGDGTSLDYKAATNWSTIDGYGTITWAKIEGSIYETQYADGTPIPTT